VAEERAAPRRPRGGLDPFRVLERAEAGEIDLDELRKRARQANRANEQRLLADWQRVLAQAQHQLPGVGSGTATETRMRARISVLEELLEEAAEHGVMWAQSAPWRKDELASA
jgi:hypothetical protein